MFLNSCGSADRKMQNAQFQIATDAFRHLLVVTIQDSGDDAQYEILEHKIKHIARDQYNFSYNALEKVTPTCSLARMQMLSSLLFIRLIQSSKVTMRR